MSIAGLKFQPGTSDRFAGTPQETKSGSYIYWGDAASFHDWKFRTELRIRLHDQAQSQKDPSDEPVDPATASAEPGGEPTEEFPFPGQHVPSPKSAASPKAAATPKSTSSQGKPKTSTDRSILVNKIVEGLRGDAFLLARDVGLEVLSQPGGLEQLIESIRNHVFPRALEEGKELFRAGQRMGGPLSRQPSESMLSYVQRRRRWWNVLTELDPTMAISESFRIELMLELSGISRQEVLVVKACRADSSFESTARVLIDHYSGIHLREGSRSWNGKGSSPPGRYGKPSQKGKPSSSQSGKGYGFTRSAHMAYPEGEDQEWDESQDWNEDGLDEPDKYVGLLGGIEEQEESENPELDYDWFDGVDETETVALNAMVDFPDDGDERQIGDAIQLQLAAHAAFGKAKGKGKGFKGKQKGKLVRSQLTLEQRRDRLSQLKQKSKCLRCGGIGHWAGDPECKFPGNKTQNPKSTPKPTAHFADISDSSSDEGVYIDASSPKVATANMAVRASDSKAKVRPSQGYPRSSGAASAQLASVDVRTPTPQDLDLRLRPDKHESIFPAGQFKGMTFWDVLHTQRNFYWWTKKEGTRSPYLKAWVAWVDKFFDVDDDGVYLRDIPNEDPVEEASSSSRKISAKKTPPNPPKPNKCVKCTHFTSKGSTAYTIRKTCLVCGHSETTRRDQTPKFSPENCPHTDVDSRGSSRTTHRTFCKLCCTFIDEAPMEIRKERVTIAKKVETAPMAKVAIVDSLIEEDVEQLSPEQLDDILARFASRLHPAANLR